MSRRSTRLGPAGTGASSGSEVEVAQADVPLFCFGAIADVQYCDIPDGTNFSKTVTRLPTQSSGRLARESAHVLINTTRYDPSQQGGGHDAVQRKGRVCVWWFQVWRARATSPAATARAVHACADERDLFNRSTQGQDASCTVYLVIGDSQR